MVSTEVRYEMVYVRAGRGADVAILMWCGVGVAEWLSSAVVLKRCHDVMLKSCHAGCYALSTTAPESTCWTKHHPSSLAPGITTIHPSPAHPLYVPLSKTVLHPSFSSP